MKKKLSEENLKEVNGGRTIKKVNRSSNAYHNPVQGHSTTKTMQWDRKKIDRQFKMEAEHSRAVSYTRTKYCGGSKVTPSSKTRYIKGKINRK